MSSSFRIEETKGYIAPQEKNSFFLTKSSYKAITRKWYGVVLFFGSKIVLAVIGLTFIQFLTPISLIASIFALLAFSALIDRETLKFVRRKHSPGEIEYGPKITAGWYPDPWAFGKVNLERYWNGKEWGTESRVQVQENFSSPIGIDSKR